MPNLVSIIIPAYNARRWIRETIESAITQTWAKKEIIIVDDGSTDNTLQIARKYESNLVKVISQENRGAPAARNKALEFAQGDYLQWLDADDLLAPEKVEKQMREIHSVGNPKILLTSAWAPFYYRTNTAKFTPDNLWRDLGPVEWLLTIFLKKAWMNPAAWLVSRKLSELAGPWDDRLVRNQDGEYICRLVSKSDHVKFVSGARSYYRQCNPRSLSRDFSDKARESLFLSVSLCIDYLRSLEDSERIRAASLIFLQENLIFFYPDQTAILEKANALAKELGGKLMPPALKWKYSLIKKFFGWRMAKRIQRLMPMYKGLIYKNWDELLYTLSTNS
jgi:glycosyltransferase involved in cell wall biosynthesis